MRTMSMLYESVITSLAYNLKMQVSKFSLVFVQCKNISLTTSIWKVLCRTVIRMREDYSIFVVYFQFS